MKKIKNILKFFVFIFLFLGSFLSTAGLAFAEESDINLQDIVIDERILDFQSIIKINPDSSLDITENITVHATNDEIKHGIYRDFPTSYNWKYGLKQRVRFDIQAVEKNGDPEMYSTKALKNGKRVYIGDPDRYVDPGTYTYSFRYITDHQIVALEDLDQLFFNITGNGWTFPINKASAKIIFPGTIKETDLKTIGYTGPSSSEAQDVIYSYDNQDGNTVINVSTKKILQSNEGLTVKLNFPKGMVTFPSDEGIVRVLNDNKEIVIGAIFLPILLLYYLYFWNKHGVDPKGKTIIPLFTAPENLSPSAIRYIYRQATYDNKNLTSNFVSAAVNGFIKIEEKVEKKFIGKNTNYEISRTAKSFNNAYPEEQFILENIFPGQLDVFTIKKEYNPHFLEIVNEYKKSLKASYKSKYFLSNFRYSFFGWLITAAYLSVLIIFLFQDVDLVYTAFLGAAFAVAITLFMAAALRYPGVSKRTLIFFVSGIFLLFIAGMTVAGINSGDLVPYALLTMALQAVMHAVFYKLLQSPTPEGAVLLSQIEGFKMFLSTAEEEDLKLMNKEVPMTMETYNKYLPYAMALDTETAWTERFHDVIEKAQMDHDPALGYWYVGNSLAFTNSNSMNSFTSSLSSTISSSSTAPSSSSGGGSGGGGGGGGGGGW